MTSMMVNIIVMVKRHHSPLTEKTFQAGSNHQPTQVKLLSGGSSMAHSSRVRRRLRDQPASRYLASSSSS